MKKSAKGKKVEEIFTGTQVGLMIEVFEDKIKILGEGFDVKIEGLEKKMTKRFDKLEGRFDNFENETNENFKTVKKFLSTASDDLDRISNEIKEMKTGSNKIDSSRILELEKEVEYLKKEISRQGKLIQLKLCA